MNKKIIVFGHKRHGKDTLCEYLRDNYGVKFDSSSHFACELFLFDKMNKEGFNYSSIEECYEDRVNHRAYWFNAIVEYNTPNLSRLGEAIFEKHDVYCGIRNIDEFNELRLKGFVDLAVYVDASGRLPLEDKDSMTLTPEQADIIIPNNGTLDEFYQRIDRLMRVIGVDPLH